MKYILLLLTIFTTLNASLHDKSAMVYYGENISYPMVGLHDYIIVQPSHINVYAHGFKVYRDKIYAYISIGEIDTTIPEYKKIKKEWILTENSAWSSKVLDLRNPDYINFLFETMIEPKRKLGFKNFFFDTLDSYQLASKNKKEFKENENALVAFISEFHRRYPDAKLIVNRGFEIIDKIHNLVEAVLFESYYKGIGGEKLAYKDVSNSDRKWLDIYLNKIKSYNIDIICVDYLAENRMSQAPQIAKKLKNQGFIPYIANRDLDIYGTSSKNAIKREVFTLIDTRQLDKTLSEAHQHGALVLEYLGYIQKLYNIADGLPQMKDMQNYAGVVIWLQTNYEFPLKLMKWVQALQKQKIKVVFISTFGIPYTSPELSFLDINITNTIKKKKAITIQDDMIAYEIEPSLSVSQIQIHSKHTKALLTYALDDDDYSTPAAITSWGGYTVDNACMTTIDGDNIWVTDPFKFFTQALQLDSLPVPDPTTENGRRLLFTHIDGDGIMNRVEGYSDKFSGEVILEDILKKYKIPHSVSVIGAEIDKAGLYPKLSEKLTSIAKEMYALDNVEGATHTFTHPFKWGKIVDDHLDKEYRLKVKNYNFSLKRELSDTLENINIRIMPFEKAKNQPAKCVFWSGDCAPRENALAYVYKNNILNINGGDTLITKNKPWLSYIGPLGIRRGNYYQIYTGAQNENVFTNDWLGPFWGFKRVVQTFEMTNSPRRLKPIDIYYHLYSGSKMASMRALHYVFDWALKQDAMPIYTSEYIPKVMDYYTASIAQGEEDWLIDGMVDLKTIRIERENYGIDFNSSKSVVGISHFENHTYFSLNRETQHIFKIQTGKSYNKIPYLIASNAKLTKFKREHFSVEMAFKGHVALKMKFNLPQKCSLISTPKESKRVLKKETLHLEYKSKREVKIEILCN